MIFSFDANDDFEKDLEVLVARLDRFKKPIVVLPEENDVERAKNKFEASHVTFISYKYWDSKKWIADDDYDHIDFFRADQYFMKKSYGVPVGRATVKKLKKRIIKVVNKEEES